MVTFAENTPQERYRKELSRGHISSQHDRNVLLVTGKGQSDSIYTMEVGNDTTQGSGAAFSREFIIQPLPQHPWQELVCLRERMSTWLG